MSAPTCCTPECQENAMTTTTSAAPTTVGRRHPDTAHHHPEVLRTLDGRWTWTCSCGGAARRTAPTPTTWRRALIDALRHSTELAA